MKKVEALLAIASIAVFFAIAWQLDWSAMLADLRAVAIGIPVLIALSVVRLGLTTQSWKLSLTAVGIKPRWWRLLGIKLASQATGYLTVFGVAASEPMKISLLRGDTRAAAAGTLADSGIYWFSSALFGATACAYVAITFASKGHGISLLSTAILFAGALVFLAWRDPLLNHVIRLFGKASPNWLRKGAQIEAAIRGFREAHSRAARKMFGIDLGCQFILLAETAVLLHFMGLPLTLPFLLGIELVARMVKLTAGWLPGRIGADEGGSAAVFMAFGFSPSAGVVLALTRRFRDLLWCALGLTWFALESQSLRLIRPARKEQLNASCHSLTES
ncbi:MAG TPA: lysylphosphatidylglycerol synthase transmembrane domain-containing protein [Candidatus Acidoferrales bacterium]|nr:lysylphosphatidylglycerol synthase transmembrane domain-containing protein [Candidatus Acidoferrales bacterium]